MVFRYVLTSSLFVFFITDIPEIASTVQNIDILSS